MEGRSAATTAGGDTSSHYFFEVVSAGKSFVSQVRELREKPTGQKAQEAALVTAVKGTALFRAESLL